VGNIAQFLPREGWPDKRRQCWNYHCLAEHDVDKMLARHGIVKNSSPLTTTKPEASVFCKKCRVAVYCSRACREEDFKAGHKKICGRPPFCIPGKQDMLFCQVIANGGVAGDETMANQEESAATEADEAAHDDDIDNNDYGGDDGSWESIDSDDDMEEDKDDTNTNNVTRQILQFFDKYNDDA
jgi:MYND finger